MKCHECRHETLFTGTSPSGADAFQCPSCDHVQFVAVTDRHMPTPEQRTAHIVEKWDAVLARLAD